MKKKDKSAGFTLIELLVVIAIIGLLSTLSLIALNNARQKSRDSIRAADVKQIMTALELYYSDAGTYPNNAVFTSGTIKNSTTSVTYMGIIPHNPTPWVDGRCSGTGAIDFTYNRDKSTSYSLKYCLAGSTGGIAAGNHMATPNGTVDGAY